MIFRWVFSSEIDAAKKVIAVAGQRLRDGENMIVEASSSAGSALRFAFGASTALAAGFLLSLGLDAIVLIGKWEILLAMAFYTGVVWALMTPILLIPRSVAGVAEALEQSKRLAHDAKKLAKSEEKRAEIQKLKSRLDEAIKDHEAKKTWWPDIIRSNDSIKVEADAKRQVDELTKHLAELAATEPPVEQTRSDSSSVAALRFVSQALYLVVFGFLVWLVTEPVLGVGLASVLVVLFLIRQRVRMDSMLPIATALMLAIGFTLGEAFQDLPLSATVHIKEVEQPIKARIIASTASELIVLTSLGATKRSVEMFPREAVRKITLDPKDAGITAGHHLSKLQAAVGDWKR